MKLRDVYLTEAPKKRPKATPVVLRSFPDEGEADAYREILRDRKLNKRFSMSSFKIKPGESGGFDVVYVGWQRDTQKQLDKRAEQARKWLDKQYEKGAVVKPKKLNDRKVLKMLGAAFTMHALERDDIPHLRYRVTKRGVYMEDAQDEEGCDEARKHGDEHGRRLDRELSWRRRDTKGCRGLVEEERRKKKGRCKEKISPTAV